MQRENTPNQSEVSSLKSSAFSLVALVVGIIGFAVGTAEFLHKTVFIIKEGSVSLTEDGKIVICAFVAGIIAFLSAAVYEAYLSHREIAHTAEKIKTLSSDIPKQHGQLSSQINSQYEEICKTIMIYPAFKTVLRSHFNRLEALHFARRNYEDNDTLRDLFDRYTKFWFNNFIDLDLNTCVEDLNRFELILSSENMALFQEFIQLFWESVSDGGIIMATSVVAPPPEGGFWANPQDYLQKQRKLIEGRRASIYRYLLRL